MMVLIEQKLEVSTSGISTINADLNYEGRNHSQNAGISTIIAELNHERRNHRGFHQFILKC